MEHLKTSPTPFHCPGHKQGKGIPAALLDFVGSSAFALDLTQVIGLDDLHQPTGPLKEAHELASRAYGADHSFFLVNGTSSGNQVMIMAVCDPGDTIIVPRNAHKSVTSALIFSGAIPVYVAPEYDYELGIDHTVTVESIEKALRDNPRAKAVLIVSPTYYGATADLRKLVSLIHDAGKIALVDEAWGPHLRFHPDLPPCATTAGADLVVNSTHKLLSGLTQSSMLHVIGDRVDLGRVESVFRLFMSTSPSCLLLASLDMARMQMATQGKELLSETIRISEEVRTRINRLPGLACFGKEIVGKPGVSGWDPTRITASAKKLGFTGYEVEKIFRDRYNVQFDLSDIFNVIALITIGDRAEDGEKLAAAFEQFAREANTVLHHKNILETKDRPLELPDWPPQRLSPREAFTSPYETVSLKDSVGRVCTEVVTPYPPGIPILCPGEEVTQWIVDYLLIEMNAGVHIQGPVDPQLGTLRVVR
ncbi:MAG: aminotransferase class I/II-fold pyridoxal phosphate-dependent enzyme [Armatimonadetes bacterium]|nr:aminotransferase class I/II-fold pyridoxal phosphate-dependent enzyme [Armatimonadota bacterium]